MTPAEFADAMQVIGLNERDLEVRHGDADDLMCQLLTELGYGEGVEMFAAMAKWYA